jgi:hypothetical protein
MFNMRSQWPRGPRCGSAADRLLGLRVRIPPGEWISVSCECCVFSGRSLCDGLITRPEEFYRVWEIQVSVILKPRWWERPWPTRGCRAMRKNVFTVYLNHYLGSKDWGVLLQNKIPRKTPQNLKVENWFTSGIRLKKTVCKILQFQWLTLHELCDEGQNHSAGLNNLIL